MGKEKRKGEEEKENECWKEGREGGMKGVGRMEEQEKARKN